MKRRDMWMAFGSGCAATLVAVWLTTTVRAQNPSESRVHVCAAADGVLKRVEAAAPCPVGQRSLFLAVAGGPSDWTEPPPEPGPPSKSFATWLADLQERVRNLENAARRGALADRVVAPFEVTDRAGKRIFRVESENVFLYNSAGRAVSVIRATDSGGYFLGASGDGQLVSSIGTNGTQSGLLVAEAGKNRIEFGKQVTGNFSARFYGTQNQVVAAIGQTTRGMGEAWVADAGGNLRAMMLVDPEGKGSVSVIGRATTSMVASLTEGLSGGGLLAINSAGGERMVAAGVHKEGFGVVQTGPASFTTAAGLGLPGSYIAGKR